MDCKTNIFDALKEEILKSDLPEEEKSRRIARITKAGSQRVNLMLVGTTGSGKSSTVNALFDMSVAKAGVGADPETKGIVRFDLGNLTIWDTPGLGDEEEQDKAHIRQIAKKLSEKDKNSYPLIDLVLVVLDASSKDLAVSYDVINNTLIPILGKENACRILIGLNQSDLAMKGRNWDSNRNVPNPVLNEFLARKADSVKRRIYESTGVAVEPVCYCAGYTDGEEKQEPYNLAKLLYAILTAVPEEKRLLLSDKLNTIESHWTFHDNEKNYGEAVQNSFWDALLKNVLDGMEKGAVVGGCIIGFPGVLLGGLSGAVIGGLRSLVAKPLSRLKPVMKILK